MPEVSGASSPGRSAEFAMRLCLRGSIEFPGPFPHLLGTTIAHPMRECRPPRPRPRRNFRYKATPKRLRPEPRPSPTDQGNPMETPKYKTALIVGAGEGLSASLARLFARERIGLALAARRIEKLGALCTETGARAFACNAADPDEVERLFGLVEREIGTPDVVVYNASARARGAFVDLVPAEVANAIAVSAVRGLLVAQQAVKRMLPNKHGAILFTGASASVKGYPQSAPFAMGKFALRGLAQSMARELSPQGIHVAHFVIDGGIRSAGRVESADRPDSMLDPDAIALNYWAVLRQPRSAWTWELELRPWVERF